jgi:cellulose synthase/poly-beta-1,6-N-acetylglucosamine synthase-like glycosyltransferase
VRRGLADKAFSTDARCGKSSGLNLGIRYASGDIIVNVDCDCSYDRYAIQRILETFAEPAVGGACGDIIPRNGQASFIASLQVIEYLMSISLGKRVAAMFDQVVCASGAFSAWRVSSLTSVGALDPGGGEDLDLTMRLRTMGWKIRFASEAICYTDVPATDWNFIRQRLRWERDAVRVRFRKHRRLFIPTSRHFPGREVLHQVDFFFFNVLLTVIFPFYLLVLFVQMGTAVFFILVAAQIGLMLLDAIVFLTAIVTTRRWHLLSYLAFIPAYTLYSTLSMRNVRLFAYMQEWFFDSSRQDTYVPRTVLKARKW